MIQTAATAPMETVINDFSLTLKINATIKPATPEIQRRVDEKTAGIVMAAKTA